MLLFITPKETQSLLVVYVVIVRLPPQPSTITLHTVGFLIGRAHTR